MNDPKILHQAIDLSALGLAGEPELFEAIDLSLSPAERWLSDEPSSGVRQAIVRFGGPAFEDLLGAYRAGSIDARLGLVRLLRDMGVRAIPALIEKLGASSSRVRHKAVDALGKLGPAAVEPLTRALADASPRRRLGAALALGEIAEGAATAAEPLTDLVADPAGDEEVRYAAIWALGQVGPAAAEALIPLIEVLRSGSDFGRILAAEALGRLGDRAALFALFIAYESEDEELRETAEESIDRIAGR